MPGPFPGMDPYLEQPGNWKALHNSLAHVLMAQLNDALPAGFAARTEERVYLVQEARSLYADIAVARNRPPDAGTGTNAVAVLAGADAPRVARVEPETARERYVEIVALAPERPVVAVIEILSPTNKARSGTGRDEYLRKQERVLSSGTHLLEVDLLRSGLHTVAVPEVTARAEGHYDYLVSLRDARQPDYCYFFPFTVRDPLPRVALPLTPEAGAVLVDLQAAFQTAYDAGPYRREIDYRESPDPPLSAADTAWADALLRGKGLKP